MMPADALLELIENKTAIPKDAECITMHDILHIKLPKKSLASVLKSIQKKPLGFDILTDLFAADFLDRSKRFEIGYNLLSTKLNARMIIKINASVDETVPTITNLHNSAMWYEREIFDMFGIEFTDNQDLRRILTDYGFVGHPLRKDFPLTGYTQVTYDNKLEQVIYEPVKLDQEYRNFDFTSPWNGPDSHHLHGDEKAIKVTADE